MTAAATLAAISAERLIMVVRGTSRADARRAVAAAVAGGIRVVEVTFTVPDAIGLIHELSADPSLLVGAGTILDESQGAQAMAAGARFLVSPGLDLRTLRYAGEHDLLMVPGTLTPTEVMAATAAGALAVKLFPASAVGTGYLTALRAPLPDLRVIPSGGVSADNAAAWLAAGAVAVGVGGSLSPTCVPDKATEDQITTEARRTVASLTNASERIA